MSDQTLPLDTPEGLNSPNHPDNEGDDVDLDPPTDEVDDEDNELADDAEADALTEGVDTDAPVLTEEDEGD